MTIDTCRQVAARIWCDQEYSHVVMDVEKCEQIAQILYDVSQGIKRLTLATVFNDMAQALYDDESREVTTFALSDLFTNAAKRLEGTK